MDLQVLVATVDQEDFSLVQKMNLKTNAIIANQTSHDKVEEQEYDFGNIKMISTKTRGVGLNRNIALLACEADILLFADDDMVYYDGTLEGVKEAFLNNPKADVIIFSIDIEKDGEIIERRYSKKCEAHLWDSMKYGAVAIAIRREALLKTNLKFSELFGGGCIYSCGEDTLFLKNCFNASLRVYKDPYVLGFCSKNSSSWFTGVNEKYIYDKGVLISYLFPKLKYLMALYYAYRLKSESSFSICKHLKLIYSGIKNAKSMKTYEDLTK